MTFLLLQSLTSCKKSEKSFYTFLKKLHHQPTNQPTNHCQQHSFYRTWLTPVQKIIFEQCLQYLCCKKEVKRRKISFKWNSILLKNHAPETCGCKNEKSHPAQFTYYSEYSFLNKKKSHRVLAAKQI